MIQIDVKPISELSDNLETYVKLFTESKTPAFFSHPIYLNSWWKHLGKGTATLLTLSRGTTVVGYLALYQVEPGSPWRLVGAKEESDYLDLVTTEQNMDEVWKAVVSFWQSNPQQWESIVLESIPDKSPTKNILGSIAVEHGYTPKIEQQDVSPVITLPSSWNEYLENIDQGLRRRIKRFTQAIQEDDMLGFKTITDATQIKESVPSFIAMHKASGNEKASFWNPQREAFFMEMPVLLAEHALVQLEVLEISNDPAAMVLSFVYQNRILGYNSGFNQYRYGHLGVGTVLAAHSIENAIQERYSHYDFMRGDEAYKFEFSAVAEPVWDITLALT